MAKSPAYWAVWGAAFRGHLHSARSEVKAMVACHRGKDQSAPWKDGCFDPRKGAEGMFITPRGGALTPSNEAYRLAALAAHDEAAAAHVAFWADDKVRRFDGTFAFQLYRSNDG